MKIFWIVCCSILLVFSNLNAQNTEAKISLDSSNILIGDQTRLKIQIATDSGNLVEWPIWEDTLSSKIEILDQSKIDTFFENGVSTLVKNMTISSFDSGYHVIKPITFPVLNSKTQLFDTIETEALLLGVRTIAVDTTKNYKDIIGIEAEPYGFGEIILYVGPILLIILLLILGIYIYNRRKANKPLFTKPKKPLPPPHIEALDALERLKEAKLWQQGQYKEFYSELTNIMRRYFERQFDFPAQEMISSEIIGSLQSQIDNDEQIKACEEVLDRADLVKFAKFDPLAQDNEESLSWAFNFVMAYKPSEEISEEKEVKDA